MKRFLVDNQLPAALARWIEKKGCAAVHVLERQWAQTRDAEIWMHAYREGAIIITKDEDFAQLTLVRPEPVAVVWLRLGNCRTEHLLTVMERAWPAISSQLAAGSRLIEVH